MDWSLVLASQGIETTIDKPGENGEWALLVAPGDMERALKTLRQYRVENRSWNWKKPLQLPDTRFNWNCLAWAGAMIFFYWLAASNPVWSAAGELVSSKVAEGQWWRLVTAIALHADLAHLAENLGFGIILFGFVFGRYGVGTGLLASGLAGITGNLASLALNPKPFHGLGASGMIMGALGLLAIVSAERKREKPLSFSEGESDGEKGGRPQILFGGVAAGVMLFVLYGLTPGTDLFAHLGGFCGGLILGVMLAVLPKRLAGSEIFNFFNGILLLVITVSSWWLALNYGGSR